METLTKPENVKIYEYTYGEKTYTRKYSPKKKFVELKNQTIEQIRELNLDPSKRYITNYNLYFQRFKDISYPYFIKCFKIYVQELNNPIEK
jgi:hypothetical protein